MMWDWPKNMTNLFFSEPRPQWKIDLRKGIEKVLKTIDNEKEDDSRNDVQPTEEIKLITDIIAKLKKKHDEMSCRQLKILLAMATVIKTTTQEIGLNVGAGSLAKVTGQSSSSQNATNLVDNKTTFAAQSSPEKQTILDNELEALEEDGTLLKKREKQNFKEQLKQTIGSDVAPKEHVDLTQTRQQKELMQTENDQGIVTSMAHVSFEKFSFGDEQHNEELRKHDDDIELAVEATEDNIKELEMSNKSWKVDNFIKKLQDSEKYFLADVSEIVAKILRHDTKISEKIKTNDIRDELRKLDSKKMEETYDLVLIINVATQVFWGWKIEGARTESRKEENYHANAESSNKYKPGSTDMEYFVSCLKNAEDKLRDIRQEELQEISNKTKFLNSNRRDIFKEAIKQRLKEMKPEQTSIVQHVFPIFQLEIEKQPRHEKDKSKSINELVKRRSSEEKEGTLTSDFKKRADKITSVLKKTPSEHCTLYYNELDSQKRNSKSFLHLHELMKLSSEDNDSKATKECVEQAEMRELVLNPTPTSTHIEHAMKEMSVHEDERNEVSSTISSDSDVDQEQETFEIKLERNDSKATKEFMDAKLGKEQTSFQIGLEKLKKDYKEQEDHNQVMKIERDIKSDLEFQEKLNREEQEDEKSFKKKQEEIDEYERETQRILEENIKQWIACNVTLGQCIRLQHRFEDAEHEWENWLDAIRKAIDGAKNRFKLFEKVIRNMSKSSSSYEKIIKNELNSLHKSTLSAYGRMYEACTTVKSIGPQHPDRIFLLILQKQFVIVCNKIYNCLLSIDCSMTNNQSLDGITQSFQQLNPHEIPTTGQLRNESVVARSEQYNVNEEPPHYSQRHETHF